jgi:Protein of unknown function (DUF3311)
MTRQQAKAGFARYWPRLLLVIPFLLVAGVPFYNRIEPALGDIPFFYWYQLAAILAGAAVVAIVYLLERRISRAQARRKAEFDSSGTPAGDIL